MMSGDTRKVHALFLSDLHLGTKGCQADRLLDFLRVYEADTIYLVGDIVDGWQLRSGWYWPQAHNDVVQKLLRKARKGTRIVYVPGNHDEFLRDYYGTHFGGVEVAETAIHQACDGRRYLVIHGDHFDMVVKHARWLAYLGDYAYTAALLLNRSFNAVRRLLGFPYWSLSQWLKLKVKNAVSYIGEYERTLVAEAERHGVTGRDLRPHPPRRDPRHGREQRGPLRQLRRLGRKLHGDRRAFRRSDGAHHLDQRHHAADRRYARGRAAGGVSPVSRFHFSRSCASLRRWPTPLPLRPPPTSTPPRKGSRASRSARRC